MSEDSGSALGQTTPEMRAQDYPGLCPICERPLNRGGAHGGGFCAPVVRDWMTPTEAVAAGVPREVIEAAWRESDAHLGTHAAADLIAKWFGDAD